MKHSILTDSFEGYSEESLTLTELTINGKEELTLLTGSSSTITVKGIYADGHTEDITMAADYENQNPDVIRVTNGRIMALQDGESDIIISYKGPLGDRQSLKIHVTSSTFPLTAELFNPNIWETGSFDENTHTLVTGQYGFGGWWYDNGIDLSEYKYVVAKIGNDNSNNGASFRLFDENSYWSGAAEYEVKNSKQVVVDLNNMYKSNSKVKLDPSHIYGVGFWSFGGSPIVIDKVYLTNSDDYEDPTGIEDVTVDKDPLVDVYTITGIKLRTQVRRSEVIRELPAGIYIVGREKVAILK